MSVMAGRRGFTLIELLVVIAIIALLMGILLPALGNARQLAKRLKCATQQREIASAAYHYAQDHDEQHTNMHHNWGKRFDMVLPSYARLEPASSGTAYWGVLYDEYLGVEKTVEQAKGQWFAIGEAPVFFAGWEVWACPDTVTMDPYPNVYDPYHVYSTYCFNGVGGPVQGIAGDAFFKGDSPQRLTAIDLPAQVIWFQDGFEHMLDGNGDTLNDLTQYGSGLAWTNEYFRHGGGVCNTLWADHHAQAVAGVETNASLPWYTGLP